MLIIRLLNWPLFSPLNIFWFEGTLLTINEIAMKCEISLTYPRQQELTHSNEKLFIAFLCFSVQWKAFHCTYNFLKKIVCAISVHLLTFARFHILTIRINLSHSLVATNTFLHLIALKISIHFTLKGIALESQRLTVSDTSIIACLGVCISIKITCHQLVTSCCLVIEANTSTCHIEEAHHYTV